MNQSSNHKNVGRIVGLWRYPVKSMGPEALERIDVSWFGLAGDRRWAFVRNDVPKSGFPWFTIRQRSDMQKYQPFFVDPCQPDKSDTHVRNPSGTVMDIADPNLGEELCAGGVRLIKQDRGIFDTFPLSLITTQTIAKLGETVGEPLHVQRFRPNFLVEATDDQPYPEDSWVGCVLRIGNLRFRVDKRDSRCAVITVDPLSTARNTEILRTVAEQRQGCLGVYGTVVEPGQVALDDSVFIESPGGS